MNKYKIILILTQANVVLWRDIKGYEGIYRINNFGDLESTRGNKTIIMAKNLAGRGYVQYQLKKDGKREVKLAHRLVAEYFIPNPYNKSTVNHKDEIKTNNRVDNLEWMTDYENNRYGSHDANHSKALINNPKISKQVICINIKTGDIALYASGLEVKRVLGFEPYACCKGRIKTTHGYKCYYKEDYDKNGDYKANTN